MTVLARLQDSIAAAAPPQGDGSLADLLARLYHFIQPYQVFIVLLVILLLIARRPPPKKEDFSRQAQAVLEEKFRRGEISREAYDRYRQDISLKPKK
jgi:uncharacterized membrane protein